MTTPDELRSVAKCFMPGSKGERVCLEAAEQLEVQMAQWSYQSPMCGVPQPRPKKTKDPE